LLFGQPGGVVSSHFRSTSEKFLRSSQSSESNTLGNFVYIIRSK
jgi:hypothetical protein